MEGKIGIDTSQTSDEVVFESADGLFSSIGPVQMRWHKLEINVDAVHKFFQSSRTFIVELLEDGAEATRGEKGVDVGINADEFKFTAILEWSRDDGVAVEIVDDH